MQEPSQDGSKILSTDGLKNAKENLHCSHELLLTEEEEHLKFYERVKPYKLIAILWEIRLLFIFLESILLLAVYATFLGISLIINQISWYVCHNKYTSRNNLGQPDNVGIHNGEFQVDPQHFQAERTRRNRMRRG